MKSNKNIQARCDRPSWGGVIFLIERPRDAPVSPAARINQHNYVNIVTCCKSAV